MTLSNKPSSRTNFDLVNNYSWQILMTANQKRGNVYRVSYYQFIDFISKSCELVPNFAELFQHLVGDKNMYGRLLNLYDWFY